MLSRSSVDADMLVIYHNWVKQDSHVNFIMYAAREAEDDGERDGRQADKCVLGQMYHRYARKQIELR